MKKVSKLAYVFPGQGSQRVGMGRELYYAHDEPYPSYPATQKVFKKADKVLGFSLSRLCFEGPATELAKTVNAQPAILTVSVAYLEAIAGIESFGEPTFVAGHSLGEYTALVAADALDFEEAVWLVRERGRLMEEAGERAPGGMVAVIGLDTIDLELICQEAGVEIANVNSPDQIVISGPREALVRAADLARASGAAQVIPLKTSGAFHSQLMGSVVQGMAEALAQVSFSKPKIPVVANTTAKPMTTVEAIKEELVRQLCLPVQWQGSVEYMTERGISTFIEIGPGKVLEGLIRKIAPGAKIINMGFGATKGWD